MSTANLLTLNSYYKTEFLLSVLKLTC